ncbi:MAG: TonB family protein [Bacteroidota bacterium]|nr:TonB family protein [Bacteroidota bacterium]
MKKYFWNLFILLFVFISLKGFAQTSSPDSLLAAPEIFSIVETMPSFPGGEEKLFQYLANNTRYPLQEKINGISGTVYVSFVVEADGSLSNIRMVKEIQNAPGFSVEALRVVSEMPSWIPGIQHGVAVPVKYTLPLRWIVQIHTPKWFEVMQEGSLLLDKGNPKEAIVKFNYALRLSPNQVEVLFERAAAYLNSNDNMAACTDWFTIMKNTTQANLYNEAKTFHNEYCRKAETSNAYKEVFNVQKENKNIREGEYKKYFYTMLLSEGQYSNNSKEGEWINYHNGKITQKGSYENDKKNGTWTYFRDNNKVSDHFYTDSILDSVYVYYENTSVHSKLIYASDGKSSEDYYRNGNIKEDTFWNEGIKNKKIYFSNGNLHRHTVFKEGYPYHDLIFLDVLGNKLIKGEVINGNGIFINYAIDSLNQINHTLTCELKEGLPDGLYSYK